MNRHKFLVLALLAVTGCGRHQEPERQTAVIPSARNPNIPPGRNQKVPAEGPYSIGSDTDVSPVRRLVDVNLQEKVSPEDLRKIALEVKAKEKRPHERTVIFYYLPVMFPELAGQPWASTHFRPDLEVKILGLTQQEEDTLRSLQLDHKGKEIGAWLPDNQYKTLDLIYEEAGTIKFAEIRSSTERSDSDMVEKPTKTGRRFKKKQGSNLYDVDPAGNLRISNAEGKVFSAARPLR